MALFSEKLYVFPCEWNLRPDHCMYGMTCDSAEENGASIIHGNREVFHNEKQPVFKAVYDAFVQVIVRGCILKLIVLFRACRLKTFKTSPV